MSWDGEGEPPPPVPQFPVFEDGFQLVKNNNAVTQIPVLLPESFDDPPVPPAEGDLLFALVGAARNGVSSPPNAQVTLSSPAGAGWNELYNLSLFDQASGLHEGAAGLWWKLMEEGDSDWTWTCDEPTKMISATLWISNNRQSGIPDVWAQDSHFDSGQVFAVAPSIAPTVSKTLLLTLVHFADNFNLLARWPGASEQDRVFISSTDGFANNHALMCFTEEWEGPGATGPRTLSAESERNFVVSHLAIAGPTQ